MRNLVLSGLETGVKTTCYPQAPEAAPGVSPGRPGGGAQGPGASAENVARCPTGAIQPAPDERGGPDVDQRRCVHCFRCVRDSPAPMPWQAGYEWGAEADDASAELARAFGRSLHLRIVDAGGCGACLGEIRQLNSPYYNMHRLGFYVTPTPREADVLLVIGPVTDQMLGPLERAYAAMPSPKRVMAVGACALSGGIFGPSFTALAGAADAVPVDVIVPGCPPPPLAILHGLLVLVRRKPPVAITSRDQESAIKPSAREPAA